MKYSAEKRELQEIEAMYPNWRNKFNSLCEAIKYHTDVQYKVLENLRNRHHDLRKEIISILSVLEIDLNLLKERKCQYIDDNEYKYKLLNNVINYCRIKGEKIMVI